MTAVGGAGRHVFVSVSAWLGDELFSASAYCGGGGGGGRVFVPMFDLRPAEGGWMGGRVASVLRSEGEAKRSACVLDRAARASEEPRRCVRREGDKIHACEGGITGGARRWAQQ